MEEFVNHREEAALAALVHRLGPMVWGVCHRMLRNYPDAEDAFQSTFLVLVRKAASVKPREIVGNWLYGVALQTSKNARALAIRRQQKEEPITDMPQPPSDGVLTSVLTYLDQEIGRLPNKYRSVIVLCDLEGKTRKEAARMLNLPEGTVAGQLARARAILAKRLSRHGAEVTGVASATILFHGEVSATVPALVKTSTINAVASIAVGNLSNPLISAKVLALTQGVITTMYLKKLKAITALLFVVSAVATYCGSQISTHFAAAAQSVPAPEAIQGPKDSENATRPKAKPQDVVNEKLELPSRFSPAPLPAIVSITDNLLSVQTKGDVTWVAKTELVNGANFTSYTPNETTNTNTYALDMVKVFDTKGRELEIGKLHKLLANDTAVLMSADGKAVNPLHLRFIKDSTLGCVDEFR